MPETEKIVSEVELAIIKYSPFLAEIRRRTLFVISLFIISAAIGFIYYERIITLVLQIFSLKGLNIVFTSPFQFLSLAINSALLLGSVAVFPAVTVQALIFVKPALKKSEFKSLIVLIPLGFLLFISGFTYGVMMMKYVLIIFFQKSIELNIGNFIDVSLLLSQVLLTSILMGIGFQFPIGLTILMRLKIFGYHQVVKQRLLVYGVSLVFAALMPPTDLLSLLLLFLPLAFLFELTLLCNKFLLKTHHL
ncbi:TPA: hypothetical protein DIV55_05355 [Patescibacteria group bacterium]|uniref:Sec-independent protein translocase protein n=1 Tax=Candidatus Gottesmanbacteria bacterium GW2011_GWA1_43_11 TaxID=1618436 RepID=A0A0G1ELZ8_9BACT|nr:MAG: Sec-independent protein translocase protein [Candidatus Gottesmanbacteria bacterium GW2011_GWA1_43_11]HCS79137.1 hypothetical protein [Patescibacteria group bacterium]